MQNTHTEELIKTKYQVYQEYLRTLDDEFLANEYDDRIGNTHGEYEAILETKGIGGIFDALEDWCANVLYHDPLFQPVNLEYKEICK